MKRVLKFLANFIIIAAIGALLHFTYEWSNNNSLIATFSTVNESTWEHLKLAFFPILIFGIIDLLVLFVVDRHIS